MDFQFLNDTQKAAVDAPIDVPIKISAGAGTGKTTVLTARYLSLLKHGYKIESLLALTFTRKAASEMRNRIFESLDDPHDILKANITNFDSFFLSILTTNTLITGLDRSVKIFDDANRDNLRKDVYEQIRKSMDLPELSSGRVNRLIDTAMNAVNEARLNLIDSDNFRGKFSSETTSPPINGEIAANLFQMYEDALESIPALDFPMISLLCFNLLEQNHELRKDTNRRFRYILLDELQDTNPAQFKILKLIADAGMKNVTAVGDDKQSIYGFRGADIDNIREFTGKEYPLTVNFRSPEPILNLGHKLICRDNFFAEQGDTIRLLTDSEGSGNEIALFSAESLSEEAQFTADAILELINAGTVPSDIAILSRTKAPLKQFEAELKNHDIPNRTIGGSYFDREEIKDILAVLGYVYSGGADKGSFARLKMRGLSSLIENLSSIDVEKIVNQNSLSGAVNYILQNSGFMTIVGSGENPEHAFANIYKLMEMCDSFSSEFPEMSLDDFIRRLRENTGLGREEIEAEYTGEPSVSLLTIHQAKGLEWDVVFTVNFRENRRIPRPDFVYNKNLTRLVFRSDSLTGGENPDFAAALLESGMMEKMQAEEIRLNYVAVTRAREKVFVTGQKLSWLAEYLGEDCPFTAAEKPRSLFSQNQENLKASFDYDGELKIAARMQDDLKRMSEDGIKKQSRIIDLNFTALRDYLHCPKYYYYRHVVRIPEPEQAVSTGEADGISTSNLGDIFHRIAGIDPHLDSDWRQTLNKILTKEESEKLSDKDIDGLNLFFENYLKLGLHKSEVLTTEKKFVMVLKSDGLFVRFSGVIDRIDKAEGKIRLIDYKTGKTDSPDKIDEFSLQLSSYGLAVIENTIPVVQRFDKLTIAAISGSRIIDIAYKPDVKDVIVGTADKIAEEDYIKNLDHTCEYCPFKEIC